MAPALSDGAAGAGVTVATVTIEIAEVGVSPRASSAAPKAPDFTAVENEASSPPSAEAMASTRNAIERRGSAESARMRVGAVVTLSMITFAAGASSAVAMASCSDNRTPALVNEVDIRPLKDTANVTRTKVVPHTAQARLSVS
jgi:hypothetical protein